MTVQKQKQELATKFNIARRSEIKENGQGYKSASGVQIKLGKGEGKTNV